MIRVTRKRLVITTVVLLFLLGILVVTWEVCDWPPPRLILKYGFPPAGGPTGRAVVHHGNTFVEIGPGYRHLSRPALSVRGTWFGNLCGSLGLPTSSASVRSPEYEDRWVEVDHQYWISTEPLVGVPCRREGDSLLTLRPFPGTLRPAAASEMWFAALTRALTMETDTIAVDVGGSAVLRGKRRRTYLLGEFWAYPTVSWRTIPARSVPWMTGPVIWEPVVQNIR